MLEQSQGTGTTTKPLLAAARWSALVVGLTPLLAMAADPDMDVANPSFDVALPLLYALLALTAGLTTLLALHRRIKSKVRQDRQRQHASEDHVRLALLGAGDGCWDWDVRSDRVVHSSHDRTGTLRERHMSADQWQGLVHPDDIALIRQRLDDHLEGRVDHYEVEHRLFDIHERSWHWVVARGRIVKRDDDGKPLRVCGTVRNINRSHDTEQERRIARQVLNDIDDAVLVFDFDFTVTWINPAFTRMTGWSEAQFIGKSTQLLDSREHDDADYEAIRSELVESGRWNGELWQRRADGSVFASWTRLNEVRDADGVRTHFVAVFTDISERKRAEQELIYVARYDQLTGLANRELMIDRIYQAIEEQPNGKHALFYLDMDRFKHINDSFGHSTGDRLLKAAGERLRSIVSRDDTVARLGGDEFAVFIRDLRRHDDCEPIARRILEAFAQPFDLGDAGEMTITPSMGISLYPDHGLNVEMLLKDADTAMYQAKESGRNTFMLYTPEMEAAANRRATLIAALRKGLDRGEFKVVYQPRLRLSNGRINGVEALLRWNSADVGEISPAEFIPIAEDAGLIGDIGDWVLRETIAQMAEWRRDGIRGLTVSINLSMRQLLRGDVAARIQALIEEFAVPADQIELELTESVVMANAEASIRMLQQLRDLGVTLSIDDFGTGYSSLGYLKRLPIDTLKIDRTFVGDLTTDADDRAITATIISMAQSLGLNVVAEGVELSAQVEFLQEHGCDEIQGFWLARPLSADACRDFLLEHRQRSSRILGTDEPAPADIVLPMVM